MKRILVINNKGGCGKSTLVISLADELDAQIVDLDNQMTLTNASEFTGRHRPIKPEEVDAKYVIYDTPPYMDSSLKGILSIADLFIVPVLVGYPDLLATRAIIDNLVKIKLGSKSVIVYNKVSKPYNKSYHTIKNFFSKNYPGIYIAKTELSELKGFQDVLATKISGKAREQIKNLIFELKI